MKILLAADGSDFTRRAARYLAAHVAWFAKPPDVHVLHVHAPMPYRGTPPKESAGPVHAYQKDESEKALAVARAALAEGHVAHTSSWAVGDPGKEIFAWCAANGVDLILMGSHGHGALRTMAMGSVVDQVLRASTVPVLIVK